MREGGGKEKPPFLFSFPFGSWEGFVFLVCKPFTLVLCCSVKETVVTEALSKSARLVQ